MTQYTLALEDMELERYRIMAARAAQEEIELWTEAGIVPGATVVDLGCGPGAVAVEIAKRVAPGGHVVGVDESEEAIAAAKELVRQSGLDNIRVVRGHARATGLGEAGYDIVNIRHVLAHNGPAVGEILAHARSLLRPGGRAYVVDVDSTAIRIDPEIGDLIDLDERYLELLRRRGNDIRMGLRLGKVLREAGFEVLRHDARYDGFKPTRGARSASWAARQALVDEGLATGTDIDRWDRALTRFADDPTSIMFVPLYRAIGRRTA